ncbi:MAG: hypothetical protein LUH10_02980 [Tannerellaceae bacterium]|nr:hypothetical protein [Tannerellaceae bacterium]
MPCSYVAGCSENLPETALEREIPELPTEVNFIYNGVEYYSKCEVIDEEVFIVDDEVRKTLQLLNENPNLCMYITPEDKIKYFDSFEQATDSLHYI